VSGETSAVQSEVITPDDEDTSESGPWIQNVISALVTSASLLSGRMTLRADDGLEVTFGPNDAFVTEPGHDAWVEGDEPAIVIDNGPGVTTYAQQR
jgi:uncharacterized cupin superfamily protein